MMWPRWLPWLRPRTATTEKKTVGRIDIPSGQIVISDPVKIFDNPFRIPCPTGSFPMVLKIRSTPNDDARIASASILFATGDGISNVNEAVYVDSATVIFGDANVIDTEWRDVGDERIGMTTTPSHHQRVAELIRDHFGLNFRTVPPFHCIFLEPISVVLEEDILRYLTTFPEYAEYPYIYFRVETKNSSERVRDALRNRLYTELAIGKLEKPEVWAMQSGYGRVPASKSQEILARP